MNTATLHQTTAAASVVPAVVASQELVLIPLSKLRPPSATCHDHLPHEEIDANRDALAKLVGIQVYEQAGVPCGATCWRMGRTASSSQTWRCRDRWR